MSLKRPLALLLSVVVVAGADPVWADNGPSVGPHGGDEIVVADGSQWQRQQETIAPSHGYRHSAAGRVVTYILDPQLRTNPAGQPCVFIGSVEGDPSSREEAAAEVRAFGLLGKYGLCPGS